MKITKQEIIDAINESPNFNISGEPLEKGSLIIEWKSKKFFLSFNNEAHVDEGISEDEIVAERFTAADFAVSSVFRPEFDDDTEKLIFHKYIIANKLNVNINTPCTVLYREYVDVFELSVKHKNFFTKPIAMRNNISNYIDGALTAMLLCVMLSTRKLAKEIEAYKENTERYIHKARFEGMNENEK